MNNARNVSLKIWWFVFFTAILFFIVALFWYQDYESVKEFLNDFFIWKNIILLIVIFFFSVFIWLFSCFLIKHIFLDIEKNNKKLKDYNHFVAHELKTPISVIYSNLEVIKYWFDEKKIESSQKELKNMIKIIDWILNFSESIKLTSKKDINVENFLNNYVYFLIDKKNIKIKNKEFNFSIFTDDVLFLRVIKNLVDNALRYSTNGKLNITIKKDRLIFENKITKTLQPREIDMLLEKFYSKSFEDKNWHWIWLPMIKDIIKVLGYDLELSSFNDKFIVEIIFTKNV